MVRIERIGCMRHAVEDYSELFVQIVRQCGCCGIGLIGLAAAWHISTIACRLEWEIGLTLAN